MSVIDEFTIPAYWPMVATAAADDVEAGVMVGVAVGVAAPSPRK